MDAALFSIRPEPVSYITQGVKEWEFRTKPPKIETPYKGYIYCTSVKNMPCVDYIKMHKATGGRIDEWHGKEHYESLKKAWNDDINTASNAFDSYDSYETAKKDYEEIMRNSWLSAETKSKLEKSFKGYEAKHYKSDVNSGYNAHSSTVTLNTPDGKVTVTYGVNSKTMKKSSGNAVFNTDVYKNAGSGQVFIVNGRPYVKLDNGDLGWVNDYLGRGALEKLKDTYTGTVYDIL